MIRSFITAVVFAASLVTAAAQSPKAVITGPKDARCGSLVVLDASESTGTGRLWLLAVSPEETSFLAVESGLKCILASPTPGAYTFVLVVSGTNANGGPAAEMATHTILLRGPDPPPVPPPDPPPDPPQPTTVDRVTYVYEKDETAVPREVAAALTKINAQQLGITAGEFERDGKTGVDKVPRQYRIALEAALKAGLPCLVVQSGNAIVRTVRDPTTEAEVTEALE